MARITKLLYRSAQGYKTALSSKTRTNEGSIPSIWNFFLHYCVHNCSEAYRNTRSMGTLGLKKTMA
jgi:hypothetical protein